mmetsp:Transcript_33427/g.76359  ORF Transcript_33427/g.76359 Transcript_33427/m.76359 type:complete len:290 (-) Transcript_33427:115-984(-)
MMKQDCIMRIRARDLVELPCLVLGMDRPVGQVPCSNTSVVGVGEKFVRVLLHARSAFVCKHRIVAIAAELLVQPPRALEILLHSPVNQALDDHGPSSIGLGLLELCLQLSEILFLFLHFSLQRLGHRAGFLSPVCGLPSLGLLSLGGFNGVLCNLQSMLRRALLYTKSLSLALASNRNTTNVLQVSGPCVPCMSRVGLNVGEPSDESLPATTHILTQTDRALLARSSARGGCIEVAAIAIDIEDVLHPNTFQVCKTRRKFLIRGFQVLEALKRCEGLLLRPQRDCNQSK